MGTIAQKLAKLLATKADIKSAITEKGQIPGDVFADYPAKIRAIQTGVDTLDATATAGDIASGKTAYVKGQKVSGTLWRQNGAASLYLPTNTITSNGDYFASQGPFNNTEDKIIIGGGPVTAYVHKNNFGDATAADVAQGKTFTSTAGIKISGTANIPQKAILHFNKNSTGKWAGICARENGYGMSASSQTVSKDIHIFLNDVIVVYFDAGQNAYTGGGISSITGNIYDANISRYYSVFQVQSLEDCYLTIE